MRSIEAGCRDAMTTIELLGHLLDPLTCSVVGDFETAVWGQEEAW